LAENEWKATPEVKTEFAKELEFYPRDYLANYMTGFLASGERDYPKSEKYLKIATEINPNWPEPLLYLGLNAYSQNDLKQAEECFRKAITLTGTDEARSNYQIRRAYVSLGRILANSGRAEESQKYLAKARDLQNKTMELSQQNVATMALAGGEGTGAAIVPLNTKQESEAAPLVAENVDPFAIVDASTFARTDLNEKQKAYAEAQENRLRSVLGLSYNDLATSKAFRKLYQGALADYQQAERWDPQMPGLQKNLGLSAFKLGNYSEAIRGLSSELQANPGTASVRAILGMAYFGSDKFSEAAKTFAPLGEQGMRDATVGYAWATSLTKLNELSRATEVLKTFQATSLPNEVLLLVGQLWIEIGDYARSVDALHRILQADGAFPKAHYFAGKAFLRWEHFDDAAQELKAELALVPEDADAKYTLGFVYLKQSKVKEAEELFRQVIALQPAHTNAQYELGKLLLDRGELKEATAHLEIAARLSPETDYVHYQLQAAYRKGARIADADREMEIYKQIKAKARERTVPPASK
jgi:tetratricopeptide (TPR) repeat protein